MVKKAKARPKTKKTSETLESRIQKKKQTFLRKLQQAAKKSHSKNHNLEDTGRVLPYTRNEGQSFPRGDPAAFSSTNILNKDAKRDDCYRCKHFQDMLRNLPRTFDNGASTFMVQCIMELSFVRAIVWLKSYAACAFQIPLAQLQQIFNEQSSVYNHRVNKDIDDIHVESLRSPVDKNLSTHERTSTQDSFVMSNPPSTSGTSCFRLQTKICTPQKKNPYAISENTQDKLLDPVSMNSSFESFVKPLTLKSTSSRHATANEKGREVSKSYIILETDEESSSIANEGFFDEHQCSEFEEDTGCSAQTPSKNDIVRVNKEIIENQDTLLVPRNYADVPSERKSILPARNQSIDPIFDLENNVDKECFSPMRSQIDSIIGSNGNSKSLVITEISNLHSENIEFLLDNSSPWQISNTGNLNEERAYSMTRIDMFNCDPAIEVTSPIIGGKRMCADTKYESQSCKRRTRGKVSSSYLTNGMPESDGSPKSLVITEVSNPHSENIKFLLDNSSPWQMSNTGNSNEERAYSTTRIDMFNCDPAIEMTSPIIGGKGMCADTKYESQSCKRRTRGKVSSSYLTNGMPESDCSPKSLVITSKYISQMSNVHNDENFGFQINNNSWRTSNMISENSEDDAAVAAESVIDKANIERCYKPQSYNELTITCEKVTASSPIIQRAVMPGTNIEHCYNLKSRNKGKIGRKEMTATPSIMQGTVTPDNNVKHHYNLRPRNKRKITEKIKSFISMIQSQKERRSQHSQRVLNLREKENANKDDTISANWLNFTIESLRMNSVIVASIKVILSTFCDKRTAEKCAKRGYWKDSLEEKAVDAILNLSDIFTTEEKPNVCLKEIVSAITKTLNEMTKRVPLNKINHIQTSIWIYRIQIILEFCNSLPVCVKIIDYLMRKLKSLQSVLVNVKTIRRDTSVIIQLHLVFYALNIALQKYRTIVPSDQRSRPGVKVVPHVADLWKTPFIDKELKHAGIDLDATERGWLIALENSVIVLMENFVDLSENSFSLVRVLNSQSSTRIT